MEIKKPVKPKDLRKVTTAAAEKNITRAKVYHLIECGSLDHVMIDGSPFVVINQKYKEYTNEKG